MLRRRLWGGVTAGQARRLAVAEAERQGLTVGEPVAVTREGIWTWLVRGRADHLPGGPWIRVDTRTGRIRSCTQPPR